MAIYLLEEMLLVHAMLFACNELYFLCVNNADGEGSCPAVLSFQTASADAMKPRGDHAETKDLACIYMA